MYIKKSVLEGLVMGIGGIVLGILVMLSSFVETRLPGMVYMGLYFGCILAIQGIIGRIDRAGRQ